MAAGTQDLEFAWIDRQLDDWGRWARQDARRLGWYRRSTLGRVVDEGPVAAAIARDARPPIGGSEIVLALEAAVAHAPERLREALLLHYVRHPHDPAEAQARRLGVSRPMFYQIIDLGRSYVLGALTGRIAGSALS